MVEFFIYYSIIIFSFNMIMDQNTFNLLYNNLLGKKEGREVFKM